MHVGDGKLLQWYLKNGWPSMTSTADDDVTIPRQCIRTAVGLSTVPVLLSSDFRPPMQEWDHFTYTIGRVRVVLINAITGVIMLYMYQLNADLR